jgi:superoxide dismutase, Cu-Zn family
MSRARTITRLKPILMPGFSAILALLSLTSAPLSARAMTHAIARWSADLAPPNGAVGPHGSVVVEPGRQPNHTRVRVVISGDTPGAVRPWHLYSGVCGEPSPIFGPEMAYAKIRINARGNGVAVIDLPIPFPEAGALFVNVHESVRAMQTIVTCGQLVR